MSSEMGRKEIIALLKKHWNEIQSLGVKSLALFGSAVREELSSESDIDLLVEFQGNATFDSYMNLKLFLEEILGRKVDLVTPRALKARLKPYIEKEAIYVP